MSSLAERVYSVKLSDYVRYWKLQLLLFCYRILDW